MMLTVKPDIAMMPQTDFKQRREDSGGNTEAG